MAPTNTITQITEATTSLKATAIEGEPGQLLIGIISPGFGSSGYYSPEVLEAAVVEKVWPAGTVMHLDHPTESDKQERPERSVLTIGAVLQEDAQWNRDLQMVVSPAKPVEGPYKDLITDKTFQEAIGVSIRASAEVSEGEIDGRHTPIIERLVPAANNTIDFVTHAGRGGTILSVLESARPSTVNARAVTNGVEEATVNDQREALSNVLRDAYNADNTWVWLRDFDETTAWFDIEDNDGSATWQQAYTTGDGGLVDVLVGERIEVRAITQYVPVDPAGQQKTEESKEDTMATTQIEESEYARLKEEAGRVTALETERDTEKAAREKAETALAESDARTVATKRASKAVAEANKDLPALAVSRIVVEATRQIPLNDKQELDETAFDVQVDEARKSEETYLAQLAEAAGAGGINGFGSTPSDGTVSEADFDATFDTSKEA